MKKDLQKHNTSGYNGVHQRPDNLKWVARISIKGKRITLGNFKYKYQAIEARRKAYSLAINPNVQEDKYLELLKWIAEMSYGTNTKKINFKDFFFRVEKLLRPLSQQYYDAAAYGKKKSLFDLVEVGDSI